MPDMIIPSLEEVQDDITVKSQFDQVAYGMNRRFLLEPASRYEWEDPKKADGIPMLARIALGPSVINNKLHMPFDRTIVSSKVAYFASNIQVTFAEDIPEKVVEFYRTSRYAGDIKALNMSLAAMACDTGTAYALMVKDGIDVRVIRMNSWECYVKHNRVTGEPEYGIYYNNEEIKIYTGIDVRTYIKDKKMGKWVPGSVELHGFGTAARPGIPLVEFPNNPERIGNATSCVNLCDAFDQALSDLSSEIGQIRMAYLLLKGLGQDASKIAEQMKAAGIILVDHDKGDAKFITKNINPAAVSLLKDTLRRLIFEAASSYDPASFTEGTPPTAFEIQQRLHNLETSCQVTITEWTQSYLYVDYLIQTFLMSWGGVLGAYNIAGIDRIFRRVAPRNTLQGLVDARAAGMVLSNQTMVELSGLQIDPIEEAARIKEEIGRLPQDGDGPGDIINERQPDE